MADRELARISDDRVIRCITFGRSRRFGVWTEPDDRSPKPFHRGKGAKNKYMEHETLAMR